jgi:hypothetical protein
MLRRSLRTGSLRGIGPAPLAKLDAPENLRIIEKRSDVHLRCIARRTHPLTRTSTCN